MQTDDAASVLAGAEFFDICSDDERRLLAFASERKFHVPNTPLSKPGEVPVGAHVLISGVLSILPEGMPENQLRKVMQPGSVVGTTALIIAKPSRVAISTVSAAETLLVPRHAFLKLLNQSPDLAQLASDRVRRELLDFMSVVTPIGKRVTKS